MLETFAKRWAIEFPSMLELSNFILFREDFQKQYLGISYFDVVVGILIFSWVALYLIYEKCLNLLFRRMYIPLTQRRRMINGLWNCGFFFASVTYLKLSVVPTYHWPVSSGHGVDSFQLGLVLHKSFYVHRAGVEIFHRHNRLRGFTDLIFALLFSDFTETKWRRVVRDLLYHKTVDCFTSDICRIALCVSNGRAAKLVARLVFIAHCLNWIYTYALFVPDIIIWSGSPMLTTRGVYLKIWFLAELMNSVLVKLFGCITSNERDWLEGCLFLPASEEAIQLSSIHKKQQEALKNNRRVSSKKSQLWQTLFCVMTLKKKLRRLRARRNESLDGVQKLDAFSTDNKYEKTY